MKIKKMGHHLAKIWARVWCFVVFSRPY